MQAKDFMTQGVISISPEHSVSHAARIMLENHISGLLVRDDEGKLLGVLSEGDLLRRAELGPAAWRSSTEKHYASAESFTRSHSWRVGDVMTRQLVTVGEDTPLDRVAAIMAVNEVNRVPVMQGEKTVGIITRSDILRAIARSVPDITAAGEQAKRRAVLTRLSDDLGLDRESIDVTVEDGIVCLWGEVESEAKREAARVVAEKIGGVGCVQNRLRVAQS
ncbi:Inosine-5'-monophosphate dehydrogenase (plasmid) [Sinorhizobium sojae CCBAU 05684]|uniref:Inosine-5'-monophosphate dehydrogenase n=1 Tax=Sinorhizobium sojae CCBAU 05684 TaxID=716928 RepID=A0A249PKF9_9HYPH|nr:CBS domain-containing protein [Sinorhizobium sojae]ASY65799.1 Inosine-5'-monophosphate dehydrogenase [Sinorhizobium sojae CCBAU 05684]